MSLMKDKIINEIKQGKTSLGIEFGSTRIKAVLIGEDHTVYASGVHDWENRLEDGIWTYHLEDVWDGLADAYTSLSQSVESQYGVELTIIGSIGFSAMMHGYMPFDKEDNLLVPFRTWRNTITEEAAAKLSEEFNFNIPQRWSIAHLYQAILNEEAHVNDIVYITTLAGYVHWKLTGKKVVGVGEASGMFPIDTNTRTYNQTMLEQFDKLVAGKGYGWKLGDILPEVLVAGETAGVLTEEGARLLDTTGKLKAGIPLCPPEGDAGTGMAATNSVARRTGNVSAGTSVFAMVVLEKNLSKAYPEIDLVTTPCGDSVAMVHANNCTSDVNAWVSLLGEFADTIGAKVDKNTLFTTLFQKAMEGDTDCGGLLSIGYFSGETLTGFELGRPLFVRSPESRFNLANFMRVHLYTALGALKIGMNILFDKEAVQIDKLYGHGGFFKTEGVGQNIMADAMNTPVSVMETAGEGGAWGMALLASYRMKKMDGESLEDYLSNRVFSEGQGKIVEPDPEGVKGFDQFITRYKEGLSIERAAVKYLR